jgi:hypothetical protein
MREQPSGTHRSHSRPAGRVDPPPQQALPNVSHVEIPTHSGPQRQCTPVEKQRQQPAKNFFRLLRSGLWAAFSACRRGIIFDGHCLPCHAAPGRTHPGECPQQPPLPHQQASAAAVITHPRMSMSFGCGVCQRLPRITFLPALSPVPAATQVSQDARIRLHQAIRAHDDWLA